MKQYTIKNISKNIKNKSLIEKKHQQIFNAVVKLFSKKGFHSTTLREISKESGVTLGNLYDYISTKEDTLYIIQKKATDVIRESISREDWENIDPVGKLKKLIQVELDTVNKYQDLILIINQESHIMSKQLLYTLLESERNHIKKFEEVIKEGIKKGLFKPTNVRMLANMIKCLIDCWVLKRWDLRGKVNFKKMEQGILDVVFNGIIKQNPRT